MSVQANTLTPPPICSTMRAVSTLLLFPPEVSIVGVHLLGVIILGHHEIKKNSTTLTFLTFRDIYSKIQDYEKTIQAIKPSDKRQNQPLSNRQSQDTAAQGTDKTEYATLLEHYTGQTAGLDNGRLFRTLKIFSLFVVFIN